jgi:hypothetical protein
MTNPSQSEAPSEVTTKRELLARVVKELSLDTSDPFTLIFANACALSDLCEELRRENASLRSATPANARAVAEKCAEICETKKGKLGRDGWPEELLGYQYAEAIRAYSGTLPEAPQPATQRSEPVAWRYLRKGTDSETLIFQSPDKVTRPQDYDITPLYAAPFSERQASGTAKVPESDEEFSKREAKNIINSADAQCFRWLLKHHSGSGKAMGGVGVRCWIGGVEFQGDDVATAILDTINREEAAASSPDGNEEPK